MKVGILTGGGDCPGLNAVIRAVTKSLIGYGQCEVLGIADGFEGLMAPQPQARPLRWDDVSGILHRGGTILGTSNSANPLKDAATLAQVQANVQALGLQVVVAIGGDGTMSLAHGVAQATGMHCVGVPKTIDNDIAHCERSFGFDTAVATVTEALHRVESTANSHHRVMIVETMGRHAGWLAGSAALATYAGAGPDLVYLPEVPFRMEEFWQDVDRIYRQNGSCMVAVSEGVQYADGRFVAESGDRDVFGHTQLGGLGAMLAESVKRQTGAKVRSIELSLLQRCASHVASKTDIDEAYMAGKAAVEAAVSGQTDKMVAFERITENGIYSCKTKLIGLGEVANVEKLVPREWLNARGNGVEQPFIDYVLPLIQGETAMQKECSLPRFAKLKKVLADPVQG